MIRKIAYKINDLSRGYNIGKLQSIRKKIKKMKRRPGTRIFEDFTIKENDEYAFNSGGRKGLQFNIGLNDEKFRYGIALSLETSLTLRDVTILYPKARRLNQFIRQHPDFFAEYKMWYYQENEGGDIGPVPVKEIPADWLKPRTFIFIGKVQPKNKINYKKVLKTFDKLLKPYIFVEKSGNSEIIEDINEDNEFKFKVKNRKLPKNRVYSREEKEVNPDVRHSSIQEKLIKKLREKYGYENVSPENPIGGNKIDVVLRNGKEFVFYEVKVSGSAKACIRDAIGQLMEYAYWPDRKNADLLVVVGEEKIDNKTMLYLKYLKDKFNFPIQYEKISID